MKSVKSSFCLAVFVFIFIGALFSFFAAGASEDSNSSLQQTKDEWPLRGGSLGQTYYSGLSLINAQNVKDLGAVWVSDKFADGATSRVTPIVKDRMMFYTAGARVYAVDAATGKSVWTYLTAVVAGRVQVSAGGANGAGVPNNQGVVVADGLVYVGLMNAHAIALDEKTGKLVWDRDLADYLPKPKRWIAAAPTYANGVLYWSITNNERFIGRAIALDGKSGRELWHFDVIPGPGEPGHETWAQDSNVWRMGGGNIWITPAVDPDLGLVYYGTGNADPIHAGETRPGNNLYTCSVVALDIKTGKLRWYYQLTHHDLWEQDLGTPIILYNLEMGGRLRKGLAAFRKDGYLFLLDRETGKPLLPITERSVPQDAFVKTAPTQPFPAGDSIIEGCSYWKGKIPEGFVLGCEFTPPKLGVYNELTMRIGAMFEPISFSSQTGYFYVQGKSLLKSAGRADDPLYQDMAGLGTIPARAPGFGKYELYEIGAIDGRTNKIVWKKVLPPVTNFGTGGWLTTAGDLAFHRMLDGNLEAFDAKTGDELWKFQTGVGAGDGTPMSYAVDGKQYVAVMEQNAVWVFGLGGTLPEGVAPPSPAPLGEIAGPIQDTDTIRTAALVQDYYGDRWRTDEWTFDPYRARVVVGAPITFINNGNQSHTIVGVDGSWTTGLLKPNDQVTVTFDKPGAYLYHRKEHPWSYGQIIVVERGSPANVGAASREGATSGSGGGFAAQAQNGKSIYAQSCSLCHMNNLGGNGESTPALVGNDFLSRWAGRTAGDLFDRIRTTMPTGAVGSLSDDAYRDLVAYILQANEYPVGNTLLTVDAMRNLSMTKR